MPIEQESKSGNEKSSAKSAQDEAMARLRAKREAKEKAAATAAKEASDEAAKAVSSAEADDVEFYKDLKAQKPKGMKLDQEKEAQEAAPVIEEAAAPARKWEFFAEHTVAPGENLSKISEKYYGNQGYWKPLYDANQAVIGDNPNVIVTGTVLKIPKL